MSAEQTFDELETMILLALDARHSDDRQQVGPRLSRGGEKGRFITRDQGSLLNFPVMQPRSAYTADVTDSAREFAIDPGLLLAHPAEILGEQAEAMLFAGPGVLKWIGLRRLPRCPKGIAYFGRATHWYEYHFRRVTAAGTGAYGKRVVPLNRHGQPLPAKIQGHTVCDPEIEGVSLVSVASIREDAHRAGTMLAAVTDATEIKFPVPLDDYRELFAQREGPLNGHRRRAIIHWVAQHLRRSHRGNAHQVRRHTRGVQEFSVDGLKITLTPNDAP